MSRYINIDDPVDTRAAANLIDIDACNFTSSLQRPHPNMSCGQD
jgi:hypothetical protein